MGGQQQGQLGNGTTGVAASTKTPGQVGVPPNNVTAVSAGTFHSLAVDNGRAIAWGSNASGQLGDGTNTARTSPVAVSVL